jgi:signal transduction histidine kinase
MPQDPLPPAIGDAAPLFGLRSVQGPTVELAACRGRLNVVLWFSRGFTCPFCRAYMDGIGGGCRELLAIDTEVIQIAPNLLKHLERMKNDFVNTVSHDLRNPISVIDGTAEVISWSATNPALQRRIQRIRDESRYMAELVTDLLDLGKIEAGLGPPKERLDAARVVAEAALKIAPSAEAKGVTVETHVPAEAWVMAAAASLTQVMLNLVGNAVKYTPSGGRVTVSVASAHDASAPATPTVTIRVADTGIGIPARHLPHVFDRFYRVHDAATKDIPGTGLGLAITRSIVESHGGRIAVESTEGAGSVFVVELPECRSVD